MGYFAKFRSGTLYNILDMLSYLQLMEILWLRLKAKEILKKVFQDMHSNIVASINSDSFMYELFLKKIMRFDEFYRLRHVTVSADRCEELLSFLYVSPHPQAFIHLRLVLLDEYSWIVDEIDKKLTSLTSQLQQLHLDRSTDGNVLLQIFIHFLCIRQTVKSL